MRDRLLYSSFVRLLSLQLLACDCLKLCAGSYTSSHFRNMEVILLSKLGFKLAAPTPSFLLAHLAVVGAEDQWPEHLARHLVELTLQDHRLAVLPPSRIAHCIFSAIKVGVSVAVCSCTVPPQSWSASCLQLVEACCPQCDFGEQAGAEVLEEMRCRVAALLL